MIKLMFLRKADYPVLFMWALGISNLKHSFKREKEGDLTSDRRE